MTINQISELLQKGALLTYSKNFSSRCYVVRSMQALGVACRIILKDYLDSGYIGPYTQPNEPPGAPTLRMLEVRGLGHLEMAHQLRESVKNYKDQMVTWAKITDQRNNVERVLRTKPDSASFDLLCSLDPSVRLIPMEEPPLDD